MHSNVILQNMLLSLDNKKFTTTLQENPTQLSYKVNVKQSNLHSSLKHTLNQVENCFICQLSFRNELNLLGVKSTSNVAFCPFFKTHTPEETPLHRTFETSELSEPEIETKTYKFSSNKTNLCHQALNIFNITVNAIQTISEIGQ